MKSILVGILSLFIFFGVVPVAQAAPQACEMTCEMACADEDIKKKKKKKKKKGAKGKKKKKGFFSKVFGSK